MAWQSCWEIKPMNKWNRLKCELFVVDAKTLSLTLALCRIHLSMDFIMIDFFRILFDFYWYDPFSFNDLSINVPILFFTSSHPIVVDDAIIFVPDQTGKNHHMKWPDADIYGNTRNLYWVFGQITLPLDGRQRQQKRDIYRYRNLFGWTSISVGRPHWWVLFIVLLHLFWYGRKYEVWSMSHEIWLKRFLH